jgi:hypothetical protein
MAMATPEDVARLQAAPPTEFTAARNRMVAELRKAGRSVEARAVARLRKPSAALWAVNRLARTDRAALASLIDTVDRLRRVQLRDPRAVADALRAQRAALEALVDRARDLLTRASLAASAPVLRRVADTLMGAATDSARAAALRRGGLTEELPPPGFEAFSGAGVTSALRLVRPPEAPRAAKSGEGRAPEADRPRRTLDAEELERQALERQRTVTRLEQERAEGQARLADLQKQLRSARRLARRATGAASRARPKAPP